MAVCIHCISQSECVCHGERPCSRYSSRADLYMAANTACNWYEKCAISASHALEAAEIAALQRYICRLHDTHPPIHTHTAHDDSFRLPEVQLSDAMPGAQPLLAASCSHEPESESETGECSTECAPDLTAAAAWPVHAHRQGQCCCY